MGMGAAGPRRGGPECGAISLALVGAPSIAQFMDTAFHEPIDRVNGWKNGDGRTSRGLGSQSGFPRPQRPPRYSKFSKRRHQTYLEMALFCAPWTQVHSRSRR